VDPDLYLESILNVTKFGMNYSFGRLHTKVNKTEWITHGRPAIVNAFYSSIENSIRKYSFRISLTWTMKKQDNSCLHSVLFLFQNFLLASCKEHSSTVNGHAT
jgi:hypothetical protein